MVSSVLDDEERFRTIIQAAINTGEVKAYNAFTKETAKSKKGRRKKAEGEAKEAEEYAKEIGVWDELFGKKKKDTAKKERVLYSGEAEVERDEGEVAKPKVNGRARGRPATSKGGKKVKQADDTSALEALIKSRQKNRQADFLTNLEAKYGAGGSEVKEKGNKKRARGRGKKLAQDEDDEDEEETAQPTEQEFQAARKRVGNGMEKKGIRKEKAAENSEGIRRSKRVKTG